MELAVEGEATLEEAVLIIARYHLNISPLTLNLFGFRQVPVTQNTGEKSTGTQMK